MLGAYVLGFDSAIATTLNIFPNYGVNILNNAQDSKIKEAYNCQQKLSAAVSSITKDGIKLFMIMNTFIYVMCQISSFNTSKKSC